MDRTPDDLTPRPAAPAPAPYDRGLRPFRPLHHRFLRGLAAAEHGTALLAGDRGMTYAEAHELALTWAGALLDRTPRPPRAVAVLGNKTAGAYVGVLAALYTGAAAVPLHPDFPVARSRAALHAAGAEALIADPAGSAILTDLLDGAPAMPVLVPDQAPVTGPALDAPRTAGPDDTALILFTSGSTGRPKGVRVTHGGADHYFGIIDERYGYGPGDRLSQTFDLTFDCAHFDLFAAWGTGASVVAVPQKAFFALPEFTARHDLTGWFSTPSVIAFVQRAGGLGPGALPSLRHSLFAGEALTVADAAAWQQAAPGSALENIYGPTELTITIAGHRFDPLRSPRIAVNGIVPIGAVHPGHRALLLAEDGSARQDEGELCVAGPQTTPGYLDPADGQGRFLDRPEGRYYRTGDRVRRLPGGELAYLGRSDAQVQVHGWRVELAEIDHAVRGCDGVQDAVTVHAGGELAVFYTGREQPALHIAAELRRTLPEPLVPRRYRHLEHFPLNANRKIDRTALTALAGARRGPAAGG
jgi:amino acid adenylation domain-containing protein